MKVLHISDELYDRLQEFAVDPFEDSPAFIINRLMEILEKAKSGGWPADGQNEDAAPQMHSGDSRAGRARILTGRVRQYYKAISKSNKMRRRRGDRRSKLTVS